MRRSRVEPASLQHVSFEGRLLPQLLLYPSAKLSKINLGGSALMWHVLGLWLEACPSPGLTIWTGGTAVLAVSRSWLGPCSSGQCCSSRATDTAASASQPPPQLGLSA